MESYFLFQSGVIGLFEKIYLLLVPLLLLCTFLKKAPVKNESYNFLYVLNTILPVVRILIIIELVAVSYYAWAGNDGYEYFSFSPSVFYFSTYIIFFGPYLSILFLWKKLRLKRWFIVLNYIFMTSYIWIDWYLMFSQDYLPGRFYVVEDSWWVKALHVSAAILLIALLYFNLHKRKKLPYPSVFLK